MHKVTKPSPGTDVLVKIPTPRLPEIRHRRKLHIHDFTVVIPAVHDVEGVARLLLVGEFDVDVSDHVIAEVVAYVEGVDAAEFSEFGVEVLEEGEEILAGFFGVNLDGHGPGPPVAVVATAVVPFLAILSTCTRTRTRSGVDNVGGGGGTVLSRRQKVQLCLAYGVVVNMFDEYRLRKCWAVVDA